MEQIEQHLLMISFLLKKNHYTCIPAIDIDSVLKLIIKEHILKLI